MKKLPTFNPLQPIKADQLNDLVAAIRELQNIDVGPGLSLRRNASGISIALKKPQSEAKGGAESCSTDTPKTLTCTPGDLDTDSWDRDVDGTGVVVRYITKFRYDKATHKLQVAYRTETKDSCGRTISISAEPAWVDVTTAELCD